MKGEEARECLIFGITLDADARPKGDVGPADFNGATQPKAAARGWSPNLARDAHEML